MGFGAPGAVRATAEDSAKFWKRDVGINPVRASLFQPILLGLEQLSKAPR